MAGFVRETVSKNHFKLLQDLYGRDLGGERFLHWKHLLDPHCDAPREKTGIFYKDRGALSRDVRFQLLSL